MSGEGEFRPDFEEIVDLICLVYHEARNVRHPIKKGRVADPSPFARLVALPTSRDAAWIAMAATRDEARQAGGIEKARQVFARRFGPDLADLHRLYAMPVWKDSALGGNKWVQISAKLGELVDADDACRTVDEILDMSHNTGTVRDKLAQLRSL
jgi:hypothetical protein